MARPAWASMARPPVPWGVVAPPEAAAEVATTLPGPDAGTLAGSSAALGARAWAKNDGVLLALLVAAAEGSKPAASQSAEQQTAGEKAEPQVAEEPKAEEPAPVVEEPKPAAKPKAKKAAKKDEPSDETVRVATSKLDALMAQVG